MVDRTLPEADRYLIAMSAAVQLSGLADRIGMAQSTQVVQTKMLDYFFSLRTMHRVAFQPIVELATGELHEYECLFRPQMPMLPQSIASIVAGGDRHGPLDRTRPLHRRRRSSSGPVTWKRSTARRARNRAASRINFTPASLLDPALRGQGLRRHGPRLPACRRRAITVECTEQQAVSDIGPAQAPGQGPAPARLRVRGRRRGRRLCELRARRRPAADGHQDRPRDRPRHLPRRREAGPRRGVRVVRPADRRQARRRGHREPRGPRQADARRRRLGQGYLLGKPAMEPAKPRKVEMVRRHAARVPSRA